MKKAVLAAMAATVMILAVAAILVLAACSSEPATPVDTAPEAPAGISVTEGRFNLPAVAGNPGAVYFTIKNDGSEAQMMRAAHVQGAESAMFHETSEWNLQVDMQEVTQVNVPAGEEVVFAPGGRHVMATGVDPALQPGGQVEVTITFVRGDKVSFPARVLAAGDDGSGS
jgi:periplasmic copper chaperone A